MRAGTLEELARARVGRDERFLFAREKLPQTAAIRKHRGSIRTPRGLPVWLQLRHLPQREPVAAAADEATPFRRRKDQSAARTVRAMRNGFRLRMLAARAPKDSMDLLRLFHFCLRVFGPTQTPCPGAGNCCLVSDVGDLYVESLV